MIRTLFDDLADVTPRSTWQPQPPPEFLPDEIELNVEATGLKWFEGDKPVGIGIGYEGFSQYLSFGHHGGGNLDEAAVKRWAQEKLRGKRIRNINTRFDVHTLREWGVDLEAQGNTVSDVGHYVALLDDHRMRFSLDSIIPDILAETPPPRVDESRMAYYHAGEVEVRARYQVEVVRRLADALWPRIIEEDLERVSALEDRVIYVVCEMEKNGSPIDLERLDQWIIQSQKQLEGYLWELARQVGFQVNPDSPKDQERVFKQLKIPLEYTAKGSASFTDAILKRIEHPTVKLMRRAGKLISLRSKFLVNTKERLDSKGILRYALHQLRATKDETAEAGEAGTVTGRFSSSEIVRDVGVNIQQRMKAARQRVAFGYDEKDASHDDEIYLLRKLHIPGSGHLLASDMDQAQYRIFAHYVNNPKVIAAYAENPALSFHDFMWSAIRPYADLTYRQQKDLNFAVIFGAGLSKMALMMGHITQHEFEEIKRTRNYRDPRLDKTKHVKQIYDREIPEVQTLLAEAAHLAKPECDDRCHPTHRRGILEQAALHARLPHRGYVKTMLGRRMRFPDGQRLHKAFNGVDQGTEADYMKTKLVELHERRKETGLVLRITNHDEIVGDISDAHHAKLVDTIVNHQSFPMRVPLTWSTTIGPNWAETYALEP
jgi:DNA polymerase I-like protein with 3'-5' exonuclease and polymerase domains